MVDKNNSMLVSELTSIMNLIRENKKVEAYDNLRKMRDEYAKEE